MIQAGTVPASAQNFDLEEMTKILLQRRKPATIIFAGLLAIALLIALLWPPSYRSSATILIEQQEIPKDLVRSTVTSYADQRIQVIAQRAMTFSNLSETIKKYDLYPKLRKREPLELVVQKMRKDIDHQMISADVVDPRSGRPVEATIAFSVSYQSRHPELAQQVVNELTSLFLSENIKNRQKMAEQAEVFFAEEAAHLEQEIQSLEQALSDFKEKNLRQLPELTSLNLNMMNRTEREYFEIDRDIGTLEKRVLYLNAQLRQLEPNASVLDMSQNEVLTPEGRVKYLQNQYTLLLATYSKRHPDVIRVKRELDELISEGIQPEDAHFLTSQIRLTQGELDEVAKLYSADHPDVIRLSQKLFVLNTQFENLENAEPDEATDTRMDNLAYLQVKTELGAVKIQLASLLEAKKDLKIKIDSLEADLVAAPSVEREYRMILRASESATARHLDLKSRQRETQLAKNLELEKKGERFTLIEPPLFPETPVQPDRLMVFILGVLIAAFAGIGTIFVLEKIDPSIRRRKGVFEAIGSFPLAVIPQMGTLAQSGGRNIKSIGFLLIGLCLFVLVLTSIVHYFYLPIDVFWLAALRKLGI